MEIPRRRSQESVTEYLGRLQRELPHIPVDVLLDWFMSQGADVESSAWLDLSRLHFTLAEWPTRRFQEVGTVDPEEFAQRRDQFAAGDEDLITSVLGNYMLRRGTWPTPPSVLIGARRRVGNVVLRRRHLLSGHHRVAYLLAMAKEPSWILLPSHQVWVVRQTW